MMIIAGTVPVEDLPLVFGEVAADGDSIVVDGHRIPCMQGTGVMISAALATTSYLKIGAPHALIAGDIGNGRGSREIYEYLIQNIADNTQREIKKGSGTSIPTLSDCLDSIC